MLIMTADELARAKRAGLKREIKGADVRNHNGARSAIQRNAKREYERFGRKQKNAALRGRGEE